MSSMQATAPPAPAPAPAPWRPRPRPRQPLRQSLRFGGGLDGKVGRLEFVAASPAWLRGRYPLGEEPWAPPAAILEWNVNMETDSGMDVKRLLDLSERVVPPAPAAGHSGHSGHPGHQGYSGHADATLGWVVGGVMLALLVLLVRVAEKCLDRRLFGYQNSINADIGLPPRLDDSEAFSSESVSNNDLPPPYSECADIELSTSNVEHTLSNDELPPPYSACYVAFSNPEDSIPSVHFFNRQPNESGCTGGSESGCEILFDNDRVERLGCNIDLSIDSNVPVNVGTTLEDTNRRNIDEAIINNENNSVLRDRVLLV